MRILSYFIVLFCFTTASAQTKISGKITDNRNRPLRGISISIKDSYDGGTSDSSGAFSFTTVEKNDQVIIASATGYKPFEQNFVLANEPLMVNIVLKESITELKAVVITAGSFEAGDQKRGTVLSSLDVVTTASANGDITSAIKTLPGTQQVGETEGLFVRGGTASESKTFIDGTLVNNFYYSSEPGLAQRGRFNPFLFKGTIFSAGGYSALYGQALSSALILESIDLPEKSSANLSLSYLGVGGGLQHLAKNKKSSWGFTYNYIDLRLAFKLIDQKPDYFNIPILHNADANFRIKTSRTGIIKYYGTFSTTDVGYRYADVDSAGMKDAFSLYNVNVYHNLSWRESLGKGWKMNTGFSFSTNKNDISSELQDQNDNKIDLTNPGVFAYKNFNLALQGQYVNAKIVLEKKLPGLNAIRLGGEYNHSSENTDFILYTGEKFRESIKENLFSPFAEGDVYLTNNLAAKIGLRAEHSSLLNKWNAAPRASLAYKTGENSQASIAYGVFYQDPENKYLPSASILNYASATHYILQYQKLANSRIFRTEIFYKKYNDLFKTSASNGRETAISNKGFGEAQGIEFFWRDKKTVKNVDYWISYSYLDTKRDFLNYPASIVPSFAAKHTASLVVKKFVTQLKTQFNASYTFATGRPFYNIMYDYNARAYKIFDRGTTRDFNNLSISVNYLPDLGNAKAKKFTVIVFSLNNVLGSNNIYNYTYSSDGKNKQAVVPPAKRFFYLGCFISFGIDRSEDAINNNL